MNVTLPLPRDTSEPSDAGDFARQLAQLLGPAYQASDSSLVEADFLAMGKALADARSTNLRALDEAFVSSATEMLAELETIYGLAVRPDLTVQERRDLLVAKVRAARDGTPQGILRSVRKIDPTATIFENSCDEIVGSGDPNNVFYWALRIAASVWANDTKRAEITRIVQQMKPAHTRGNVAVSVGFLTDDPNSLTDRDVLGE
jgi:uncharacterized protein YmfQ (DUF2313 family)